MPQILAEWTAFAKKTAPTQSPMSNLALTDHAEAMLNDIALDIETHQSTRQQFDKSQGDGGEAGMQESAAGTHGRLRQASNFSLYQLSSEFRALRATVLRLWMPHVQHMSEQAAGEMVRFNEAIDQALSESIETYSARADRTRELFLAVLGHDLRAPIATMSLVGDMLARTAVTPQQLPALGQKTKRSAMLMSAMVTDLLGFARVQMGAGMPVLLSAVDLQDVCRAAIADAQAMYPHCPIAYHARGDLRGSFDAVRMQQLVTNLLINAAQHSASGSEVTLDAVGGDAAITLTVRNVGPVIPQESLQTIFQPLVQLPVAEDGEEKPRSSLGLGLFIAQETTTAHQGSISVTSSEAEGTVFTARFPRAA